MPDSEPPNRSSQANVESRRAAIKRWAEYVRTHDDEEWSRKQNRLIDSQLETANELAARGEIDPAEFVDRRDRD